MKNTTLIDSSFKFTKEQIDVLDKNLRKEPPTEIIIHCSASDNRKVDMKEIDSWHRARKFTGIGYNFFIGSDAKAHIAREVKYIGAHCKGRNYASIGICLNGDTHFSLAQLKKCRKLIHYLMDKYPSIERIVGHNYYNKKKTCPNFSIRKGLLGMSND